MSGSERLDWVKIGVIGVMCMAQTFPYYLVNSTVPTLFRAEGLELTDFWAFSILTIPAWAKFLWAPYVDRHGWTKFGRRKSWILVCTLLGAVSVWALVLTTPSQDALAIVVAVLFIHMMIMATQDIAVDAYTLENLTEKERGAGSAFKVFAEAIGEAMALGGLMFVYTSLVFPGTGSGWITMVLIAGLALILFTTPVILRAEPPMSEEIEARRKAGDNPRLSKFILRPDTPPIVVLLFVGGFINFMLPPLAGPLLVDYDFSLLEVGLILGIVTPIGAPLGAIVGGALITRFGLKVVLICIALAAIAVGTLAVTTVLNAFQVPDAFGSVSQQVERIFSGWDGGPRVIYAITIFTPVVCIIAMLHMVFTVSRMGWASRTQAGTDFTLHGACYNIGRTFAVALSPFIAAGFGWPVYLIVLIALISGLCIAYWALVDRLDAICDRRRVSEGELILEPT